MAIALPYAVEELIDRIGGPRRAAIAGVGLVAVLAILGLSHWASAPSYVPVYSDLPLETVGKITGTLDENGVLYRLERGGTELQVPSTELARVRVLLAGEGLPGKGRPGLELFDQPSWGMTDFAQRINYRRALEGELERTIGKMSGVELAQVHLAMEETRSFQVQERPTEASVVLKLRSGMAAAPDVVRGVQHLVASSVGGLQSDNVTVLDDSGRMLSAPNEPGSIEALTSRQLSMQREVEGYLENKAQALVDQVVGVGNARVKVAAEVNFDRVERTVEKVDPDLQVLASEQKSEIVPGAEGGAGSSQTSATYENSRSMESFTGAMGNVKRLSVAVVVDEKQVLEGDAVAYQPRTAAELAQIETLVRNSVGVDEARGDLISVVGMRFSAPPASLGAPPPSALAVVAEYRREIVLLIALLVAAFVALRVVRSLRPPEPVVEASAVPALETGSLPEALPAPDEDSAAEALLQAVAPKRGMITTSQRMRNEVLASVEERPEAAARLVRAWLKE